MAEEVTMTASVQVGPSCRLAESPVESAPEKLIPVPDTTRVVMEAGTETSSNNG